MNNMTILDAEAQGSQMSFFIMMGAVIFVMYWFMLRPQNKKRKAALAYRENIQKGDKIVTIGGIHGKVDSLKDTTVVIIVEGGMKMEMEKSAVSMDASMQMTEESVKQST
jgi:preprotein translocase subunit YajC